MSSSFVRCIAMHTQQSYSGFVEIEESSSFVGLIIDRPIRQTSHLIAICSCESMRLVHFEMNPEHSNIIGNYCDNGGTSQGMVWRNQSLLSVR